MMDEAHDETRSVTLTRTFDAPLELVWSAWIEPEHVVNWMKCDVEASLEVENWAPIVGQRFSTHMWQPGVFDAHSTGTFIEVDPPRLLSYTTDADPGLGMPEVTVRVEFRAVAGKTELTLTHSGLPSDQICGIIEGGWTASLSQLETLLAELAARDQAEVTS